MTVLLHDFWCRIGLRSLMWIDKKRQEIKHAHHFYIYLHTDIPNKWKPTLSKNWTCIERNLSCIVAFAHEEHMQTAWRCAEKGIGIHEERIVAAYVSWMSASSLHVYAFMRRRRRRRREGEREGGGERKSEIAHRRYMHVHWKSASSLHEMHLRKIKHLMCTCRLKYVVVVAIACLPR